MNNSGWTQERLLIPRWRSFARTIAAGELTSLRKPAARDGASQIERRLQLWSDRPSLATAAGAVETALAEGQEERAADAARHVLREFPTAMPMVRAQAVTVLRRAGFGEEVALYDAPLGPSDAREWRAALRVYPYDAIGWMELALHQVMNNTPAAAERSISIALALAPNDRHILRSAARFYLHRDEPDRAHDLIQRNPASRVDPWLLAAEISLARTAQRSPRFMKLGESVLQDGGYLPFDLSELAGAVGTDRMLDGRKGLRKLFRQSLMDPTANALAQGEWASKQMGDDLVSDESIERVPEAFEALAFHRYREFRFAEVPDICEEWARSDGFSVRPFEFGSTAAGHALDFSRAAELARKGLKLRPTGAVLLNCLAFALGSMGDVEGAVKALNKLNPQKLNDRLRNVMAANIGLCAFRSGKVQEGLAAYRRAIEGFMKMHAPAESASARAYLAREAAMAGLPEAGKLLVEAEDALRPFKTAEAQLIIRRLRGEDVDAQLANARQAQEQAKKLARLRAITWTTPGLPGKEGVVGRLLL